MTERHPAERVVITGMGVMSPTPNGYEVEGFTQDLRKNRHGIRRIDDVVALHSDEIVTRVGSRIYDFSVGQLLEQRGFGVKLQKIDKEAKRWGKSVKAMVYTGAQALRQADLLTDTGLQIDERQLSPKRFGIYEGTGIADSLSLIEIDEALRSQKTDDPRKLAELAYALLHLLGGRVDEAPAIAFKAQRFNDTMLTECAAGLSSVDRAMDDLRLGRADIVLAGGVEMAAHYTTIWAFETLKALNKSGNHTVVPRPFSRNPGGLVVGEGAGNVVLETLEHARWRQKKLGSKVLVLAEVLGTGKSSDAYHDTAPSQDGAGEAIDYAVADSGLTYEELANTLVLAHATATGGDINELLAIQKRFNIAQLVGIVSIKGHTGHTFGASGSLSLITGVQAMRDNIVPSNRNLRYPLPEAEGWPMVPHRAIEVENIGYVLVNAFGFGGKNRVALLGPPPKV